METTPLTPQAPQPLHPDRSQRVVLDSNSLDWVPSPQAGVERRMLEREGGETGRAASLVRYAPGATYADHAHPGGEEIYVLEGALKDQQGVYPAGTYIRNPPGSHHHPSSDEGCTLLVRLGQMEPEETERLVLDSNALEWKPGRAEGIEIKNLFRSPVTGEWIYLARFSPGCSLGFDEHEGGEELFILAGKQQDEHGQYPAGTWVRQPVGSCHTPFSEAGATILVRKGHMKA